MRFSRFNDYIEFYKIVEGAPNEYGESPEVEQLIVKCSAQVNYVRGNEEQNDGLSYAVQYVNFTTWMAYNVSLKDFIKFNGKKYNILYIEPINRDGVRYVTRVEPD